MSGFLAQAYTHNSKPFTYGILIFFFFYKNYIALYLLLVTVHVLLNRRC